MKNFCLFSILCHFRGFGQALHEETAQKHRPRCSKGPGVPPAFMAPTVYNRDAIAVHGDDMGRSQMAAIGAVWRAAPLRS
jgi:hypothetical protein